MKLKYTQQKKARRGPNKTASGLHCADKDTKKTWRLQLCGLLNKENIKS